MEFTFHRRVVRALLGTCVVALTMSAGSAYGYSHNQPCSTQSDWICLDNQGQIYNPWIRSEVGAWATVPTFCTRAYTAAGNDKSGGGCNYNTNYRISYYQASPSSRTRGAWSSPSGANGLYLTYSLFSVT